MTGKRHHSRHRKHYSRRKRSSRKGGLRGNLTNDERRNVRTLLQYEIDPTRTIRLKSKNTGEYLNDLTLENRIRRILDVQTPLASELIVWRGQHNCTIEPSSWFSTSKRDDIARSYGGTCAFKIHLQPGIKCIDLYKVYETYGIHNPYTEQNVVRNLLQDKSLKITDDYVTFEEVIVQEGGTFWEDAGKTTRGFKHIGQLPLVGTAKMMDVYETYYFPAM